MPGKRLSMRKIREILRLKHECGRSKQHLIAESSEFDLAVLDLTPFVGKEKYITEAAFVSAIDWPPRSVTIDDVICMAGFPGIWRDQVGLGHLRFYSFSSGAAEVVSVRNRQIATTVQIQDCITHINDGIIMGSLGGLNGGPVFPWRKKPVFHAELIGFIFEYQKKLDIMLVRSATIISEDGTIKA